MESVPHTSMRNMHHKPFRAPKTPIPSKSGAGVQDTKRQDRNRYHGTHVFEDGDDYLRKAPEAYEWVPGPNLGHHSTAPRVPRRPGRSRSMSAPTQSIPYRRACEEVDQRLWKDAIHNLDVQIEQWIIQEKVRQLEALREAEKTRMVQEEVHRLQERIYRRKEAERRYAIWKAKQQFETGDHHKKHGQKSPEKMLVEAWKSYEERWATISASKDPLSFKSIPWPIATLSSPPDATALTLTHISSFILSPLHSKEKSTKERLKEALKRWHPDRFRRIMPRIVENDKKKVEEAVSVVTGHLNELLNREGRMQK